MNELITIIVPVYNIEKYLPKCVNSIIKQSYEYLDIILVDDGSQDSSPAICDKYSDLDKRIRVIHKMNGGLSDARNTAIPLALGNYILFVDGDDYIDQDYVQYLYSLMKKYDADLSICEFMFIYENGERINHPLNNKKETVFNTKDALREMMKTKLFSNSASGKLYKKSAFSDVKYPVGRLFEDTATTYKLLLKANRIAFGARALYYYIQHDNTISTAAFSPRKLDSVEFVETMTDEIVKQYPELYVECYVRRIDTYIGVLKQIKLKENNNIARDMHQKIIQLRKLVLLNRDVSLKRRLWAAFSFFPTPLYMQLIKHI